MKKKEITLKDLNLQHYVSDEEKILCHNLHCSIDDLEHMTELQKLKAYKEVLCEVVYTFTRNDISVVDPHEINFALNTAFVLDEPVHYVVHHIVRGITDLDIDAYLTDLIEADLLEFETKLPNYEITYSARYLGYIKL